MKLKHWINLIVVGLTAGLLTFLAMRWGITSYAEPKCRSYAESKGMTYVRFLPPDASADTGSSHLSRDGNCQLQASNGEMKTVSLVSASGSDYGAPFLVHFALGWEFMFMLSFFVVAFFLAIITRLFKREKKLRKMPIPVERNMVCSKVSFMNLVNVGYDSSNYYVIEQKKKRILIDVGWPGTLPKLIASLRRKSLALEDLDYLCVTHFHPDHAGLVQELKNKGVKHIVFDEQLPAIPLLRTYIKPESGYVDITVQDSIRLVMADSRAWLSRIGFKGEMVSTPGHSDDSISLVLDEGIAFTGDLMPASMVNVEQVKMTEQSWDSLRQLKVRMIYPGHGPARPFA